MHDEAETAAQALFSAQELELVEELVCYRTLDKYPISCVSGSNTRVRAAAGTVDQFKVYTTAPGNSIPAVALPGIALPRVQHSLTLLRNHRQPATKPATDWLTAA